MPTLTVFTPSYNAADTLPRVYTSLERQTTRDFAWLIVDDGSTDETRALVEKWKAVADFPIDYVYQPNSGKHNAHNLAVDRAQTDLFLILDADDELLPEAVAIIVAEWNGMTDQERCDIAGIWTLCVTPSGVLCGREFPSHALDTSLQDLRYRFRCEGERLPCFATAALRRHRFPQTPPGTCPYIPEAYVWSAITRRQPLRFLNARCRVYHSGRGLSELARKEYRVSRAIVYAYAQPLVNDLRWFGYAPAFFVFSAAQTVRFGLFSKTLIARFRELPLGGKLLMMLAAPLGVAVLARDYASGRIATQFVDIGSEGRESDSCGAVIGESETP